jgi:PEP-CTERM motif
MNTSRAIVMLLVFSAVLVPPAWADSVVSIQFSGPNFGGPGGFSTVASGVEAAAATADPVFGSANVWNALLPTNTQPPQTPVDTVFVTNPSWSGLVDSTGTATGVSLSITGTVGMFSIFNQTNNTDPVRSQTMFWNHNDPNESTTITWQIAGLAPNSAYDLFMYGSIVNFNRSFDMTIGGTTQSVDSFAAGVPPTNGGTLFQNVFSDASGVISGTGTGVGSNTNFANEANWSGIQVAPVPEPSTIVLFGAGLVALLLFVGKRA